MAENRTERDGPALTYHQPPRDLPKFRLGESDALGYRMTLCVGPMGLMGREQCEETKVAHSDKRALVGLMSCLGL